MDLSKAYDCLPHDLLLAKLEAYGFSFESLRLMYSYLNCRNQRVKIGSIFSKWLEIVFGIPQGSILGPLLFNIFINDLLLFVKETELCNFADDNSLYACDTSLENVLDRLKTEIRNTGDWFSNNSMLANPAKFQLMFLGLNKNVSYENIYIDISGNRVFASKEVKLLGVTIDNNLNFNSHINSICYSANNSLCAFRRIRNYLTFSNAKVIYNSFVFSRFLYCSVIWMFCSKKASKSLDSIHKRALRVLYQNPNLPLKELLKLNESSGIHLNHLRSLMIEVFKSVNKINPEFMWEIFSIKQCPYNFRRENILPLPPSTGKSHGANTLVYKAITLWNSLGNSLMSENSLEAFKSGVKNGMGVSVFANYVGIRRVMFLMNCFLVISIVIIIIIYIFYFSITVFLYLV